jgi:pimeloyl-ACP methyl ester carboxylesterase
VVLYLHGADGNMSDTVDALTVLHREDLAVFAFDYRGYGQSQAIGQSGKPSEMRLRQDAEWALNWLTLTKHIPAKTIIVYGSGLGANLAAELAADHSELAGMVLDNPYPDPMAAVFGDARSKLVPAHWMVADHYDLNSAARRLRLRSLWILTKPLSNQPTNPPDAYASDPSPKSSVWLSSPANADKNFTESLGRWLDDL